MLGVQVKQMISRESAIYLVRMLFILIRRAGFLFDELWRGAVFGFACIYIYIYLTNASIWVPGKGN